MAAFQPLEQRAVSAAAADGPRLQGDRASAQQQLLDFEGGDEDAAREQRPQRWGQVRRALVPVSLAAVLAAAVVWRGRERLEVRQEALQSTVMLAEFNCEEGYENFLQGWSAGKRNWCCTFKKMGCPGEVPRGLVDEPFDCAAGASNWETGWSAQKKIYCCSHKEIGCPLVNDVYVTFVLANVNYDALMATEFLKGEVWTAIKQGISAYVVNDINPSNIDLWYWRGSGLHSTTSDAANTGTVVRARIHVPKISKLQSVRDLVLHADFPLRVSTSVTRVPGISTVSFDRVFVADVEVEQSIVAVCTCVNGVPETRSPRCPRIGGEVCEKCHAGFHLTSGFYCLPNTCTCTDGIAAQGELCKNHGTAKCASCSIGFHLENDQCLPNVCNCTNGFGATGLTCVMHQGLICGSCYPGFSVDPVTRECKQSKCICESGIAATGEACTDDGAEICASCDPGFHVSAADGATCERNMCKCRHGVAALGPLCTYHEAEICAYCNASYYLQKDGTCGPKVCLCPNGTAVESALCGTHHAILCQRCDKGYSLLLGQCINTPCECRNGLPLSMDACTKPGLSICGSCHRGYHLTDERECLPNVCTCQNGQPGVGRQCPVHEGNACSSCNPGYRTELEQIEDQTGFGGTITMSCKENICTCLDGTTEVGEKATGKSNPPCYTNGGNVCVACKPGYHIGKGNQCFRNSCRCPHGTSVDDSDCSINNARNCSSCDPGYFLAAQAPGDIQEGYEAPDPAVFAGKARVCLNAKMTTSAPFNCEVGMDNWEQAWSEVKKQYCCDRKNVGCIPKSTGKELCEGQGFNQQQCNLVGCCRYDATSKKCLSAVGNRVCFYEFNIKTAEGYCVQAIDADPDSAAKTKLLKLHNCNQAEKRQEWRPKATGQILNPVGECIQVTDFKAGALVIVSTCDDDDDIDPKQIIKFDLSTQLLKVGKGDSTLCLTAHYMSNLNDLLIKLAACSTSDPNQRFSVALEGGGRRLL